MGSLSGFTNLRTTKPVPHSLSSPSSASGLGSPEAAEVYETPPFPFLPSFQALRFLQCYFQWLQELSPGRSLYTVGAADTEARPPS